MFRKSRVTAASQDVTFPYNRILQWIMGPLSVGMGLLFGWVGVHLHVVIPSSVHDQVVTAVAGIVLAAIGAVVTFLSHYKWFKVLEKWLDLLFKQGGPPSAITPPLSQPPASGGTGTPPVG